uniref:Uncharacterized protein n=1 Tax=Pyropia pulchra TaxID=60925 RepID=O24666_9RHOD|nr:ORF4 [Pyropia pulchra]
MIYEEPIDYLTYLLSTSQMNLYETVLNTKEGANQSTFANLFSQAQKESPISNPDSFLHKLLIINLKDFDENRWSPTMYTSFIFKSLMLITTLSLVSQLDSVNESPGGSGLASLSRNLKSFQKSKKQIIQENKKTPSPDTSIRQNDQQLDEILKELSSIKNLLSKVPDEVANSVVGVPYSRFDSTTTCLPCLIFHFLEVTDNSRKRSSQIKVRVNLENIVNDNSAFKVKSVFTSIESMRDQII